MGRNITFPFLKKRKENNFFPTTVGDCVVDSVIIYIYIYKRFELVTCCSTLISERFIL